MKPIVYYKNDGTQRIPPEEGGYAMVTPINHTSPLVSNTGPVFTSHIVRLGPWGEFETRNTIYRPDRILHDDD